MGKKELLCDCDTIHTDTVEKVRERFPVEDFFTDISNLFKTFGDGTRAKILWALDMSELCVCDISALLDMTKSAVSHQLKYLREANLIKCRRDGKVVYYSLADDHVKQIFEKATEHIYEKKRYGDGKK